MKTIEEKARAYDKALAKARELYNDEQTHVGMTPIHLTEIFPELAESEDERIRKEILDYIIKGSESCYDIQQYGRERFKKWIAWLEKQGEQKVNYTTLVETGNGGINALITRELSTNGCDEQKPAWSEEDEKLINSIIELIDNGALDRDEKDYFIEKLKFLKERYTWKPSNEQMEYLAKAITTLGNEGDNKTSAILYELRTDLKKLKG